MLVASSASTDSTRFCTEDRDIVKLSEDPVLRGWVEHKYLVQKTALIALIHILICGSIIIITSSCAYCISGATTQTFLGSSLTSLPKDCGFAQWSCSSAFGHTKYFPGAGAERNLKGIYASLRGLVLTLQIQSPTYNYILFIFIPYY